MPLSLGNTVLSFPVLSFLKNVDFRTNMEKLNLLQQKEILSTLSFVAWQLKTINGFFDYKGSGINVNM